MRRTGHALTILAFGWALLLAPAGAAVAEPASSSAAVASGTAAVLVQAPDQQKPDSGRQLPEGQRFAVGIAGVALIALVLGSRKARKKPILLASWKRKG